MPNNSLIEMNEGSLVDNWNTRNLSSLIHDILHAISVQDLVTSEVAI